jgi:predicted membrane GTPase involved in stress response
MECRYIRDDRLVEVTPAARRLREVVVGRMAAIATTATTA